MTQPPERVILFSCADWFRHEIALYEDTWYDHILARRAILASHEAAVVATLEVTAFTVDGPNAHERWEY